MPSKNIFEYPISTSSPPSCISTRPEHPAPRLGIKPQNSPIQTNKFYANFSLGGQGCASWTHPYSVSWSRGGGPSKSWGLAIHHIDEHQKVFGPDPNGNPAQYFFSPVGIQSLIVSATDLGGTTCLASDSLTAFSANISLSPSSVAAGAVSFPLVQGMAFLTGIYNGATPAIQTGVFFRSFTRNPRSPKAGVTKYNIILENGKCWLLYAYSTHGAWLDLKLINNSLAQATSGFHGFIQIAKNPGGAAEAMYDAACGVYPITTTLSGNINGPSGSYTLSFAKGGLSNVKLAMFALPHHIDSFSPATRFALTNVKLDTTTKGVATAVLADSWTLVENLPVAMGFAPWSPELGSQTKLSPAAIAAIRPVAESELAQDMNAQTNLNSMYFSGKALAKFAHLIYTTHALLHLPPLASPALQRLKVALSLFTTNRQQHPLVHETAFGGLVSSASYTTGDPNADFGNTYYNDHHFHYGYFILTAAIIGCLDPSWLTCDGGANKEYINALVRDIANPSPRDPYFPVSRAFDWYHGHSWAHGLYESADGKDQESSSEDAMFAYAVMMWGRTVSDADMEARGALQLAITARSLQHYYLFEEGGRKCVQPQKVHGNKVAGILFENKLDHATYFGMNIEFIHGIHMLPILPCSTLTRTRGFVREEWERFFEKGRVDKVGGGWRGVLYANWAVGDPREAWRFFSRGDFDPGWIDGGASRTWYLAWAAALGGCP